MIKDLDRLMREHKINAIFATGKASTDPTLYYLLRGVGVSGYYIKRRGKKAVLVHSPIEREEARKTGLRLVSLRRYDFRRLFASVKDPLKASALGIAQILDDLDVRGRVAFYGLMNLDEGFRLLGCLKRIAPRIEIASEGGVNVIAEARETKDAEEIGRIKRIRNGVVTAFDRTITAVAAMRGRQGVIIKPDGRRLLVGDLKRMISQRLFECGFINSTGMIVSQGRDAGVPHNSGRDGEVVRLGRTIVFDIFPQEIGGGYFFDFTRTICFGHAPERIHGLYTIVRQAQELVESQMQVGRLTSEIEESLCRFFERHGHPTLLSTPTTEKGYCHSAGHGVGLEIHERPSFGLRRARPERIRSGVVMTNEPGLYYPEDGFGIRLEDVIHVAGPGKVVNLTRYRKQLVVPLRKK